MPSTFSAPISGPPEALIRPPSGCTCRWLGWRSSGPPATRPKLPAAPTRARREVYLVDKPGAPQSQIRIGTVGVPRSTPDYFPLQIANTILGGAFSSRLNMNLREKHGYSYGAASQFDMRG